MSDPEIIYEFICKITIDVEDLVRMLPGLETKDITLADSMRLSIIQSKLTQVISYLDDAAIQTRRIKNKKIEQELNRRFENE